MSFRLLYPLSILLLLAACDRANASDASDGTDGAPAPADAPEPRAVAAGTPAAQPAAATNEGSSRQAEPVAVECTTAADAFPGEAGTRIAVRCPSGCTRGAVWGTDLYSDDSAICVAAVHAGVLDAERGGVVELFVATGATHYPPSTRHGVTTQEWPEWQRSFAFPAATPGDRPVAATCTTRAQHLPGPSHVVACPAGCAQGQIWGTDLYSDDSMICPAAIHAGVLAAGAAGAVKLDIAPGAPAYAASERHGIRSAEWPAWPRSFRVSTP